MAASAIVARWRHAALAWAERRLPSLTRLRRPESLPIRLDRRRIYTLPTGFGIAFALLLLVMLLGALNYGNNAAILLTCLVATTAGASLFFAFRNLSGLTLTSVCADEVHAGDVALVRLEFFGGARQRPSLRCESGADTTFFLLDANGTRSLEVPIATTTRGWWLPGRIGIATDFPFGLFRAWSWLHPDRELLVFPRAEAEPPPLPFSGVDDGSRSAAGNDDEFGGLRGYRPSDAPRRIAWKASARRDDLLVREEERSHGSSLVLDYARIAGLDHEARIARLTAWVLAADARQLAYALVLPDLRLDARSGSTHRNECLRALALLPA